MQKKTKIVCTLGPATDDDAVLRDMIAAGMDVARINFSHGEYAEHDRRIKQLMRIRGESNAPIALMLDTKGPEIRLKTFKTGSAAIEVGQKFTLTTEDVEGDEKHVSVTYPELLTIAKKGMSIMIDDGNVEMKVDRIEGKNVVCTVINGTLLKNNKSINLPGVNLPMPYISKRDLADIKFGIEHGFDFIAASFVRTADDVRDLRRVLKRNKGDKIKIIAKIENRQGVDNIDEILRVSDGIMVARGDMGVEIPFEELPYIQKLLIRKTFGAGRMVITATQMLESMIDHPRPTRAEMTDIANAVYDGTSAVMLSGETAVGAFPAQAVSTMSRIISYTESNIDYVQHFGIHISAIEKNVTNAISHAACTTALDIQAIAIVTVTESGETARMISKFRPPCPIIGCATDEQTRRQLNLSWGVTPLLSEKMTNTDDLFANAVKHALKSGIVKKGDLVVLTAGVPVGVSGTTNIIKVATAGAPF